VRVVGVYVVLCNSQKKVEKTFEFAKKRNLKIYLKELNGLASPKLVQGYQVHKLFFLFFSNMQKTCASFVIKVEKFNTNNAFLASALKGLQNYNCGLDYPNKQIHNLILHK
jgi:hypothetical protein